MSETIAFLLEDAQAPEIENLARTAERFGYSIVAGIDAGDEDATPGISRFLDLQEGTYEVIYVDSDRSSNVPSAFAIYEELFTCGSTENELNFFVFLREIKTFIRSGRKAYFLACTEWSESDEVRYLSGSVEALISYLSVMRTLGMWLWSPLTGAIQDSDRYPLVFRMVDADR